MAGDDINDSPGKRHGHATVGIGAPKAPSAERLLGRRARLLDALKRAEGERKTALQAELATIDGRLADLQKLLAAALAPPAAEA